MHDTVAVSLQLGVVHSRFKLQGITLEQWQAFLALYGSQHQIVAALAKPPYNIVVSQRSVSSQLAKKGLKSSGKPGPRLGRAIAGGRAGKLRDISEDWWKQAAQECRTLQAVVQRLDVQFGVSVVTRAVTKKLKKYDLVLGRQVSLPTTVTDLPENRALVAV